MAALTERVAESTGQLVGRAEQVVLKHQNIQNAEVFISAGTCSQVHNVGVNSLSYPFHKRLPPSRSTFLSF